MNRNNKILAQSGFTVIGIAFTTVVGFFFKIYVARELGAENLGIYVISMSMVTLISGLSPLGLGKAIVKFIALYNANGNDFFLTSLIYRSILSTVLTAVGFLGFLFLFNDFVAQTIFHDITLVGAVKFIALLSVLFALYGILEVIFQGFQQVSYQVLVSLIRFSLKIGISFSLIYFGFGLEGYLIGELVAVMLAITIASAAIWKLLPLKSRNLALSFRPPWDKRVIYMAKSMLGIQLIGISAGQLDKVLLGGFLSPKAVGLYSIVLSLAGFLLVLLQSVNKVLAPMFSELFTLNKYDDIRKLYLSSCRWILLLTAPLAISFLSISNQYLMIFGSEYVGGSQILVIIVLGYIINVSFGPVGTIAEMTGLDRQLLKLQIINQIVVLCLFWLLIPRFGLVGAALSLAANHIISNCVNAYLIFRERRITVISWNYLGFFILMGLYTMALNYCDELIFDTTSFLRIAFNLFLSITFSIVYIIGQRTLRNEINMIIIRFKEGYVRNYKMR